MYETVHLKDIGPEPLDKKFTLKVFKEQLNKKPNWKVKLVLMDQSIIAGIGNIYADESLWRAGVHPEELIKNLNEINYKEIYKVGYINDGKNKFICCLKKNKFKEKLGVIDYIQYKKNY